MAVVHVSQFLGGSRAEGGTAGREEERDIVTGLLLAVSRLTLNAVMGSDTRGRSVAFVAGTAWGDTHTANPPSPQPPLPTAVYRHLGHSSTLDTECVGMDRLHLGQLLLASRQVEREVSVIVV